MKSHNSYRNDNQITNLYLKNKLEKTHDLIHRPTEFTLSIPLTDI